ncbi:uncharacterized [Tachysurus ichikawai]
MSSATGAHQPFDDWMIKRELDSIIEGERERARAQAGGTVWLQLHSNSRNTSASEKRLNSISKSSRSLKPQPYCTSPGGQTDLETLWNQASEIWLFKSSSYELDCCARRSGLFL